MKYHKLLVPALLLLITLSSCNRIKKMFGGKTFSEYIVEANNNTTEKDKEAINEYNYSVLLADSVLDYFNSNDSTALGRCVEKMKNKRNDATGHVKDDYLNDLFEKSFLKIDKDLDKYGVPQEIVYPISIREDCNLIKINENGIIFRDDWTDWFQFYNVGCDKSGRLYRVIQRCWGKKASKVGVPDSVTIISDNDGTYHLSPSLSEIYKRAMKKSAKVKNVEQEPFIEEMETEEDRNYMDLCDEVEKEYMEHPENFVIVSTDIDGFSFYISKNGNEYNFASEAYGISELEDEGVYALFNEQKFVKRK